MREKQLDIVKIYEEALKKIMTQEHEEGCNEMCPVNECSKCPSANELAYRALYAALILLKADQKEFKKLNELKFW